MASPYEWRIDDIERTANEAKHRLYELDTLRSDVGSLEHILRETRAEADVLRGELETASQRIDQIESQVSEILYALANVKDQR